jgi:hypothetical protein
MSTQIAASSNNALASSGAVSDSGSAERGTRDRRSAERMGVVAGIP